MPSRPPALDLVLPVLRCPICAEPLSRADTGLRCPNRHNFDIARQGYVSLLAGARATSGDDASMAAARLRFLAAGIYAPILADLVALAERSGPSPATIVDAGCGTGHYLAGTVEALAAACGIGLDSSTSALRSAARAHPRAAAIACDLFRPLPIASGSVDLVLVVFAPRNPAEFRRILRPGGTLVVTRPTDRHLAQLRRRLAGMTAIDPVKEPRLEAALGPHFEPLGTVGTEYTAKLTAQAAADLALMTPARRRPTGAPLDEAGDLPTEVDVSVLTTAYRPLQGAPLGPQSEATSAFRG